MTWVNPQVTVLMVHGGSVVGDPSGEEVTRERASESLSRVLRTWCLCAGAGCSQVGIMDQAASGAGGMVDHAECSSASCSRERMVDPEHMPPYDPDSRIFEQDSVWRRSLSSSGPATSAPDVHLDTVCLFPTPSSSHILSIYPPSLYLPRPSSWLSIYPPLLTRVYLSTNPFLLRPCPPLRLHSASGSCVVLGLRDLDLEPTWTYGPSPRLGLSLCSIS